MKKLPIGIGEFRTLITEDYIYVDKTMFIEKLLEMGKMFFLSRPRRFGKSLFVSTLEAYFSGEKELFRGLYIYDRWKDEKHPVIRLVMTGAAAFSVEGFENKLNGKIKDKFRMFGMEDRWEEKQDARYNLERLLSEIKQERGKRVVVLIDEYDAPLTTALKDRKLFYGIRDRLRNFYGALKDNQDCLRFLFVTGVTKFAHVSLFSGFNNLMDISLHRDFATICGYTEDELVYYFRDYLPQDRKELEETLQRIREWYNGYDFYGYEETSGMSYDEHRQKMCVYNPYDVLFYLQNKECGMYWFETATPSFLVDYARNYQREINIEEMEGALFPAHHLRSFDFEGLQIPALMFQTGYLTLDRRKKSSDGIISYSLRIPNKEVRISLGEFLLLRYFEVDNRRVLRTVSEGANIMSALAKGEPDVFFRHVSSLYAGLPYETATKIRDVEGYHRDIFFAILWTLGIMPYAEDTGAKGRADLSFTIDDCAYVMEFKIVERQEGIALNQIKDRKYHSKYIERYGKVIIAGIEYDPTKREIRWAWEEMRR